jgi:hypothetical protein
MLHAHKRRALEGVAVGAAMTLLVACGSTASPNTSAAASAAASVAASVASPEASAAASASPPATLSKLSFKGDTALTGGGNNSAQLQALLGALGKTASDVSIAVGAGEGITVGVYQINGVDANTLMGVLGQAAQQGQTGSTVTDASKGGKSVKVLSGGSTSTAVYFYAHGDLLFFVSGDDAKATDALTKLP